MLFGCGLHFDFLSLQNLVKLNTTSGRPGYCSQLMPRARETVPKVGVYKDSLERHFGSIQLASDFSKDHPKSCDICSRPETLMNSILFCSSCKVFTLSFTFSTSNLS